MSAFKVLAPVTFGDPVFHREFWHRVHGRVLVIGCHPHDGACLVIERQIDTDPEADDQVLDTCERSDLSHVEPQDQWPYLGFTVRGDA